ncbi:MAG: hypothetical protein JWP66_1490 [Naasia sp.]|nr:hypothetical protein [Naasia sp.]
MLTATPAPLLDETVVTPGVVGFLVWFAVALITVLLIFDMVRRIRRTRYRAEFRERIAREEADAGPQPDAAPAVDPDAR